MRVIHVVPAVSNEAAGPSYSVPRLCESFLAAGLDVTLATLNWSPGAPTRPYQKKFPLGFGPRQLGVSPQMRDWLVEEVRSGRTDLIHSHSLWMMPNVYTGRARRAGRTRLVVSPRGTVSQWALAWRAYRKKIFWSLCQERALRAADCFHATSEEECADLRRLGFAQPISMLPNGIDVPPLAKAAPGRRRRLLFLGRIHPIKGLDVLLRAWQTAQHRFPDWDLHVAGPDNSGHLAEMRDLSARLGLERVAFLGPLFGEEKRRAYREAELFVLPTLSENFGMTVAEALAAGTPAIVSKGAPWGGLERMGAGWWIDIGLEPLVAVLERALAASPETLAAMGRAGRDWMLQDYEWESIAAQHAAVYRWLVGGGAAPACVRLS